MLYLAERKKKKKHLTNIGAIFLDFYSPEMKIYKITFPLGQLVSEEFINPDVQAYQPRLVYRYWQKLLARNRFC